MLNLCLILLFFVISKSEDNKTPDQCKDESCVSEQKQPEKVKMEYRYLGPSGLQVSVLGYGNMLTFNQVGEDGALEILKYLVDNGVNFIDTAETYSKGKDESILGAALEKGFEKGYFTRSQLVITTKVFFGDTHYKPGDNFGLSRKHIFEGVNASLKRLKLDYVDIVFCHRPDDYTPIEETVRAMHSVIEQGKAFYWGTSEWPAHKIREAHEVATRLGLIHPIVEQPEYSLIKRKRFETEYAPLYKDPGLGTTVWGVLASGLLTGKFVDANPEDTRLSSGFYKEMIQNPAGPFYKGSWESLIQLSKDIGEFAKTKLDCTATQLAIAWVIKNPHTSTVLMGGKLKYLEENLGALKVVPKLTDEVLQQLEVILKNKPIPDFDWRESWKH